MNDTLPNSRDPLSVVEPSGLLGDVLQAPRTVLWGMVAAFVVYQLLKVAKVSKSGKLPPGPKGVPFFGNLFQLSKDAWVTFAEWGKQYGMISLSFSHALLSSYLDRGRRLRQVLPHPSGYPQLEGSGGRPYGKAECEIL